MRLMFLLGGFLGLLLVAVIMCAPLIREAVDPDFDRTGEYTPNTELGEFLHSIVHIFIDTPMETRITFAFPAVLVLLCIAMVYWKNIG